MTAISRLAPGIAVMRAYDRAWLRPDVLAGVTVAAYLVPQCMAYAEIAGLPPVVGLWAILPPLLIYAVLGSSRQLSVGPESTTAIMTAAAVGPLAAGGGDYAVLCAALALLVGGICVLARVARLGFIANLLSKPILVGYITGVALIMIAGQLGKVSGVPVEGDGFFAEVRSFLTNLDLVHGWTLALSIGVLVFLFVVARFFPKLPAPLLAVGLAVVVVQLLDLTAKGVSVVGTIPAGLPRPSIPDASWGDLQSLLAPAFGIMLVGYSDNVLTARAFAGRKGTTIDANQELLALGASNLGSGLFGGFPISSSGSRTVIGDSVGSRTQVYSVVCFASVIAVLLFLRPLLEQFPNAALGALVVYAAIRLVDVREFRSLLRFRRTEFAIALATTAGVLLTDILVGVAIAIGLSVVDLLGRLSHPHDAVLGHVDELGGWHDVEDYPAAHTIPGLFLYRYDAPLFFANAEDFRKRSLEELEVQGPDTRWFVLQAEAIGRVDATAAEVLGELLDELDRRGITFAMAETKWDLREQLDRLGITDRMGADRFFATLAEAVEAYRAIDPPPS